MNDLSVCLYPLNGKLDSVEAMLKKQFSTFKVTSESELKALLKNKHLFCIVIGCNIRKSEDITKVRKICSAFPKIPWLFYGKVSDQELVFRLSEACLNDFVENGNTEQLIDKLHDLKAKSTFQVDLRDFGVDLDQCSLWTRKFLNFVVKDYNFFNYTTVRENATVLGTSSVSLAIAFQKDCQISPKQVLICLRNYYAAYLLDTTNWSAKAIAQRCGFANEHQFYKSFRAKTGLTVKNYRSQKHWQDYPTLYQKNI